MELVIVIAVIAVVAAVLIPTSANLTQREINTIFDTKSDTIFDTRFSEKNKK